MARTRIALCQTLRTHLSVLEGILCRARYTCVGDCTDYTRPTRDPRAPIIAAISFASYRPPITKAPNRFRVHSALWMHDKTREFAPAARRWSGKFVVDGVKQGTKLIDRTLIITRCRDHYSRGTEHPLLNMRIIKHFRQKFQRYSDCIQRTNDENKGTMINLFED